MRSEPDLRRWASYSNGVPDGVEKSAQGQAGESSCGRDQVSSTGNFAKGRHVRFAEPIASPVTVLSEKARGKQPAERGPKEVRFALVKDEHVETEKPDSQPLLLSPTEYDNFRALLATLDHLQFEGSSSFVESFRAKLVELKKPYSANVEPTGQAEHRIPRNMKPSNAIDTTRSGNSNVEEVSGLSSAENEATILKALQRDPLGLTDTNITTTRSKEAGTASSSFEDEVKSFHEEESWRKKVRQV